MFLLDEPLSALDLKLREGLRAELRQIHRQYRSTMLYATHDYHGAIAIADRLAIIDGGVIQQTGTIDEIIALPANMFVGRLIGSPSMAFFDASIWRWRVSSMTGGGQKPALSASSATVECRRPARCCSVSGRRISRSAAMPRRQCRHGLRG